MLIDIRYNFYTVSLNYSWEKKLLNKSAVTDKFCVDTPLCKLHEDLVYFRIYCHHTRCQLLPAHEAHTSTAYSTLDPPTS